MITNQEVKRRAPRMDLRARLRFQVRGRPKECGNAVSSNISANGVAFNANRFYAPQTALMLEIDILSRVLHPIGRVAWCEPLPHSERNRLGVEFLEFDPQEKNFLEDYIRMQTGRF